MPDVWLALAAIWNLIMIFFVVFGLCEWMFHTKTTLSFVLLKMDLSFWETLLQIKPNFVLVNRGANVVVDSQVDRLLNWDHTADSTRFLENSEK